MPTPAITQIPKRHNEKSYRYAASIMIIAGLTPLGMFMPGCGGSTAEEEEIPFAQRCDNLKNWDEDISQDKIRELIRLGNINYDVQGTVRWEDPSVKPIPIYTGGVLRFEEAVNNIERMTRGLIKFERVTNPANITYGIEMVEGGSWSCGNVDNQNPTSDDEHEWVKYDNKTRHMTGKYYAFMSGRGCSNDAVAGQYPSAVAEHELMHILGLFNHFEPGYGDERAINGIFDDYARALLINIYQLYPGIGKYNLGKNPICSY